MSKLRDLWQEMGKISNRVDRLGERVEEVWRRPKAKGRETPFWGEKQFLFQVNSTEPIESPLVHSAGSVTRVTRLIYDVRVLTGNEGQSGVNQLQAFLSMRQTPRGMVLTTLGNGTEMFDFEWTYTIGSTERKYSTANPSPDGWNWLSRFSLGNPETGGNLLFSPKHPLILRTNEFLTFRIRPILWTGLTGVPPPPDVQNHRISVNITYAGYRTFGYGV